MTLIRPSESRSQRSCQAENLHAGLLHELHGGKRIGSLAALAHDEAHVSGAKHGVAVAKLGGIFHLDGDVGEFLNEILANQGGVPTGAAGGDYAKAGRRTVDP